MIQIVEEDHDILQFLWLNDITEKQPQIVNLRFTRVISGVSSSPLLLNTTIQHHLKQVQTEPTVVRKLTRSFYVNDIATRAKNEADTYQLYCVSKEILKTGGFNLRKFCSDSLPLQVQIDLNEAIEHHIHPYTIEAEKTYTSIVPSLNKACVMERTRSSASSGTLLLTSWLQAWTTSSLQQRNFSPAREQSLASPVKSTTLLESFHHL